MLSSQEESHSFPTNEEANTRCGIISYLRSTFYNLPMLSVFNVATATTWFVPGFIPVWVFFFINFGLLYPHLNRQRTTYNYRPKLENGKRITTKDLYDIRITISTLFLYSHIPNLCNCLYPKYVVQTL